MMACALRLIFVVATPGRLIDLLGHNAVKIRRRPWKDEADRPFDLGFGEELKRILALLPTTR
jgi:superfamily II DNA/RNA helicase